MTAYGSARKSSSSGSKSAWTGHAGGGSTAMGPILPAREGVALVARPPSRHALEELGPARLGQRRVELAVRRRDVDRDPLRVTPAGEVAQVDVVGGALGVHAGVEARLRLVADVGQVALDLVHALRVRDRSVPGDEHARLEREDPVAGAKPVLERAGPDDRRALDEQDVAGEDDARVGHVDDRVAVGVRRADLDEPHRAVADAQLELALERVGRRAQLDALEAERPEDAAGGGGGDPRAGPPPRPDRDQEVGGGAPLPAPPLPPPAAGGAGR